MLKFVFALAVFLLIAGFAGVGVLTHRKRVRLYALLRLAAVVISVIVTVPLSILVAKGLSSVFLSLAANNETIGLLLQDAPVLGETVRALLAMFLAPAFYFVLFLIVRALLTLAASIIAKVILRKKAGAAEQNAEVVDASVEMPEEVEEALQQDDAKEGLEAKEGSEETEDTAKKKKKKKQSILRSEKIDGISMLCGGICGFLICFAMMIPVLGMSSLMDTTVDALAANQDAAAVQAVADMTDASANNPCSKTLRVLGGDALYSWMTTQKVEGQSVSLKKEVRFLSSTMGAVTVVSDEDASDREKSEAILSIEEPFSEANLIPAVLPEFFTEANAKWEKGDSFCGIESPMKKGGMTSAMLEPVIRMVATADAETIRHDGETMIEILAIVAENGALKMIASDPLSLFENTDLSSSIIYKMLDNDHMRAFVGEISTNCMWLLGDQVGVDLRSVTLHAEAITDVNAESKALSNALAEAVGVVRYIQSHHAVDSEAIRRIGPVLEAFSSTQMAGEETTQTILVSLLKTPKIQKSIGFSEAEIDNLAQTIQIHSSNVGYTTLLDSVGSSVELINMSTSDTKDITKMNEKVEELMNTMTPAAAEVLQAAATPSFLQTQGVPEQSAEATSKVLSSVFSGLSQAKESGMSEEEYKKEASATTNMINLAMNAKESGATELFGEDSATGKTADEFIGEVFESTVISQTIIETVYPEGDSTEEPVMNPLSTGRTLKENEKTQLVEAMNNQWQQATEEQREDAEYQKKYVALGAMMNLPIEITEEGIIDGTVVEDGGNTDNGDGTDSDINLDDLLGGNTDVNLDDLLNGIGGENAN